MPEFIDAISDKRTVLNGRALPKPALGRGCQMLSSYRIPKLLFFFAVGAGAALIAPAMLAPVAANPFTIPHNWAAATVKSIAEPVRRGGRGGFHRGSFNRGAIARRGVARRGVYRGVARRGIYRGVAAGTVAGAVIGRRYYGGVYYGHRRHYWRGRWWAYGVGSCWRITPDGYYVWICG